MNVESGAVLHDGVASIVTALGSAAELHAFGQDVDNLALSFITPLRSEDNGGHFGGAVCAVLTWLLRGSPSCVRKESSPNAPQHFIRDRFRVTNARPAPSSVARNNANGPAPYRGFAVRE